MVAFKAGVSPPAVKIPIRFIALSEKQAALVIRGATPSGIKQAGSQIGCAGLWNPRSSDEPLLFRMLEPQKRPGPTSKIPGSRCAVAEFEPGDKNKPLGGHSIAEHSNDQQSECDLGATHLQDYRLEWSSVAEQCSGRVVSSAGSGTAATGGLQVP